MPLVVACSCVNQGTAGGRNGSTGVVALRRVALLLTCVNRPANVRLKADPRDDEVLARDALRLLSSEPQLRSAALGTKLSRTCVCLLGDGTVLSAGKLFSRRLRRSPLSWPVWCASKLDDVIEAAAGV